MLRCLPIFASALFVCLLSGQSAFGQGDPRREAPREQARPATPQVQIFTLRNAEAAEMVRTLHDLFNDERRLRMSLHRSTNSIVVMASAEDLELIGAIIGKLDILAGEQKKN
jgi:hypothetical protein